MPSTHGDSYDSFDHHVFDFHIYPYKHNDCYPFDELCLTIGFDQHIDINSWNNDTFGLFINNLKLNHEGQYTFTYQIENRLTETWTTLNGQINLNIRDFDPKYWYDTAYVIITNDTINKLELIYNAIREFKNLNSL